MKWTRWAGVLRGEYEAILGRWEAQRQELAREKADRAAAANPPRGDNANTVQPSIDPLPLNYPIGQFQTYLQGPPPQILDPKDEKQVNAHNDWMRKTHELMRKVQESDGEPGSAPHKLAALCFSGGGIRSATFNLGVLQRLAWHGLLDQFDYLSTVSGGGFIGSWLMAWACRKGGLRKVANLLARPSSAQLPEPAEVSYLRNYSRYLSPRFSILSADLWTLVAIYVRNLFLNWLVLIPLLLAALMLPRMSAAVIDLFPLLESRVDCKPAGQGAPTAPATVTMKSSTPIAQVSVVITEPSQGAPASRPTTCPAEEAPAPVFFGTAPVNYIDSIYLLGILLVGLTLLNAIRYEPPSVAPKQLGCLSPNDDRPRGKSQSTVLKWCLSPLLSGAMLLTTAWAWDERQTSNHYLLFVGIIVVSMALVTLFANIRRKPREIAWQLMATVSGAVIGATLLYLSAKMLERVHGWAPAFLGDHRGAATDGWETAIYVWLATPLVLASLAGGAMVRIGVLSRLMESTDEIREWWSRFGAWVIIATLSWIVLAGLVLFGPALLLSAQSGWGRTAWAAVGGASGLLTIFLGKSSQTPATDEAARSARPTGRAMQIILAVAAPLFVCFSIVVLSLVTDGLLRIRFPALGSSVCGLNGWAQQHLTHPPPCETGVAGHFAMVEVFNDTTGCDPQLQSFLKPLKSNVTNQPALALWAWGWHAGVNGSVLKGVADPPISSELARQWEGLVLLSLWFAALALLGVLASFAFNLNRFSLHGTYRNRLVRAYLGASRPDRSPDRFTGFDEADNFPMAGLGDAAASIPIHVINMTLNLAGEGSKLSWQDRKAESFVVTPFSAGSYELGYRDTKDYGGRDGISVGTAVAISGAAVSPNMGSHSSPAISFLLTLFNVRVGAWLGNPGKAGDENESYRRNAPRSGALHVVAEAFGLTDATHEYVYLSDGGHFENLGLYEMVRRRCRYIVVCDAGADPDYGFEDLANAVRKIRIDFGIPITFKPDVSIVGLADKDVAKGRYCATGRIWYSAIKEGTPGEDGFLLYIKPAFYKKNEPIDVRGYKGKSEAFPQEPTANQFFTEPQFESYRALGEHIVDQIQGFGPMNAAPVDSLDEFQRRVERNMAAMSPQPP